jgi:hypothetical protein
MGVMIGNSVSATVTAISGPAAMRGDHGKEPTPKDSGAGLVEVSIQVDQDGNIKVFERERE